MRRVTWSGREMLLVLAGNKMDHDEHRTVPADQARMFAESIGTTVCYVSAKAGKGVEQAFQSIASGESAVSNPYTK